MGRIFVNLAVLGALSGVAVGIHRFTGCSFVIAYGAILGSLKPIRQWIFLVRTEKRGPKTT